jgi:alpha-N-arabinofuranosidase
VNNLTASEYAAKAARWAHALKLLDPTISLISCGETGASSWDYEVLQKLAKWVDYHSIHRYSNLDVNGEFDGQDDEYERNVFGPAA